MAALLLIQETTTQKKPGSSAENMHVANIQITIVKMVRFQETLHYFSCYYYLIYS